ncbi:MAG: hypothetical protein NTW25_16555 [Candidatus Kapabacteria bacterium]|nr:hypothetical protein [Candidatus Kapabacteria bacterium]
MQNIIIVNKLYDEPGFYGTKHSKEEITSILQNVKEPTLGILGMILISPLLMPYIIYKELIQSENDDILRKLEVNYNLEGDEYFKEHFHPYINQMIVILPQFVKSYSDFNNKIFSNNLISNKNFEILIPKYSGNELYIIDLDTAKNVFLINDLVVGQYNYNRQFHSLTPLSDYSFHKWKFITSNLFNCFRNIGATHISIHSIQSNQSDINFQSKSIKGDTNKVKFNFGFTDEFSFITNFENPIYDSEKALFHSQFFKNELPITYDYAKGLINTKSNGNLDYNESVKFNFDLSIDLLNFYQNNIRNEYVRLFNINIVF